MNAQEPLLAAAQCSSWQTNLDPKPLISHAYHAGPKPVRFKTTANVAVKVPTVAQENFCPYRHNGKGNPLEMAYALYMHGLQCVFVRQETV